MAKLFMQNQCILNYRQLHEFFSPRDMLQEKRAFAQLAHNLFGNLYVRGNNAGGSRLNGRVTGEAECLHIPLKRYEHGVMSCLFTLAVLRCMNKLDKLDPKTLSGYSLMDGDITVGGEYAAIYGYLKEFEKLEITNPVPQMKEWVDLFMPDGTIPYKAAADPRKSDARVQLLLGLYDIVKKTNLTPRQQTELLIMLQAGYLLAGHTLKTRPLTAEDARNGYLEQRPMSLLEMELGGIIDPVESKPAVMPETPCKPGKNNEMQNGKNPWKGDKGQSSLPEAPRPGSVPALPLQPRFSRDAEVLELKALGEEKPYRMDLHPALKVQTGLRLLPEGSVIQTHFIKALPDPLGLGNLPLVLHFYLGDVRQRECKLKVGEYLCLNVVHHNGNSWALLPQPIRVKNGEGIFIERDTSSPGVLHWKGETLSQLSDGKSIGSIAPLSNGRGILFISDGRIFCREEDTNALGSLGSLVNLLRNIDDECFVELALKGTELYVLTETGRVIKSHGSAYKQMNEKLLTLMDVLG